MIKCLISIILILLFNICKAQSNKSQSEENNSLSILSEFIDSIKSIVNKQAVVIIDSSGESDEIMQAHKLEFLKTKQEDTGNAKNIINKFFVLIKNDQTRIDTSQVIANLSEFYSYFSKENIAFIKAKPLKFFKRKSVYKALTEFKKENTYILFDSRSPSKILYYVLIIPAATTPKGFPKTPKILSLKIVYLNGNWYFEDLLGQDGLEVLFE